MKWERVLVPTAWSDGSLLRPLNAAGRRVVGDERAASSVFPHDAFGRWRRLIARSQQSRASLWIELVTEVADGSERMFLVGVSPEETGFIVTLIDRSESKQAVLEGQRASGFFRDLLDQTPTIFFVLDRGGRVVFRNAAFDQLAGEGVEIVSPASLPQVTLAFHEALVSLFRLGKEQQVPIASVDPLGQVRRLQFDLEPLRDSSGRVHQALVIGVDLTELMTAHVEQRRLQGKLEQARRLEALGQMAGTIAHDFNNFITVMLSSTMLLRELLPNADGDVEETLAALEAVSHQAKGLTQDLVAFSRAQVHSFRSSSADRFLISLQASIPRLVPPTVDFSFEMGQTAGLDLLTVPLSESQGLQIVVNLVQNALEAAGQQGKIRVRWRVAGPQLSVSVEDDGPGIPETIRARILEPFFTTRGDAGGTGLGLSSVRSLIEHAGGSLNIADSPLGGAKFQVALPLKREESRSRS